MYIGQEDHDAWEKGPMDALHPKEVVWDLEDTLCNEYTHWF
jgi:hypothetical protein